MQFNSTQFLSFFLIFYCIYLVFSKKYRIQNVLLLAASYTFYGFWDVRFLFLITLSSILDYTFAIIIHQGRLSLQQRITSGAGLGLSFIVFIMIQYSGFGDNWKFGVNPVGWTLLPWLCVGIALLQILYSVSAKWQDKIKRKFFVTFSVVISLIILGFFKYFNFFVDSFSDFCLLVFNFTPGTVTLNVILPIGISFYIFKTISYIVDVYRKELDCCESLLDYAIYLAFFPQLLAGPIERAKNFLPQLQHARSPLSIDDVKEAVWLIGWGVYKKMVIADNMAIIANQVFKPYDTLQTPIIVPEDGFRLLLGILAFTMQIYGDFSGYTDIARGIGRLLGFKTMRNFNLPYFSISPIEFWKRWHISLSTWLRDYLYIPLGGNRGTKRRTFINLFLTMLLGGLWHGAAWNFVLWGAYHGLLLVIYRKFQIKGQKAIQFWHSGIHMFITFILITFGWLLFRAHNTTTIFVFIRSIFTHPFGSSESWEILRTILKFNWFLILFQIFQYRCDDLEPVLKWNGFIRLTIWVYIIMSLLVFTGHRTQNFIYFAF